MTTKRKCEYIFLKYIYLAPGDWNYQLSDVGNLNEFQCIQNNLRFLLKTKSKNSKKKSKNSSFVVFTF